MLAASARPKAGDKRAKVLPFKPVRAIVTRLITRLFLHDVRDFLFDADRRARMADTLRRRIAAGGGPFIVIAHSQGSMIAYDVLRALKREEADVRLFVTIGSPLGMDEVQDVLKEIGGPLRVPECVARWVNVAERLDPVALDPELKGEFARNGARGAGRGRRRPQPGLAGQSAFVDRLPRPPRPCAPSFARWRARRSRRSSRAPSSCATSCATSRTGTPSSAFRP